MVVFQSRRRFRGREKLTDDPIGVRAPRGAPPRLSGHQCRCRMSCAKKMSICIYMEKKKGGGGGGGTVTSGNEMCSFMKRKLLLDERIINSLCFPNVFTLF